MYICIFLKFKKDTIGLYVKCVSIDVATRTYLES